MTRIVIDMPKGTGIYAADVELFVIRMLKKLAMNTHKGHWENIDVDDALDGIQEEVLELERAMAHEGPEQVHDEAADVANFAMMVSSITRRGQ